MSAEKVFGGRHDPPWWEEDLVCSSLDTETGIRHLEVSNGSAFNPRNLVTTPEESLLLKTTKELLYESNCQHQHESSRFEALLLDDQQSQKIMQFYPLLCRLKEYLSCNPLRYIIFNVIVYQSLVVIFYHSTPFLMLPFL